MQRNNVSVRQLSHSDPLRVALAATAEEVREAQRLRYRVFREELGARLETGEPGMDSDHFDPYCDHLLVRDTVQGQTVACTRILTDTQAAKAGRFYAETELDLTQVLAVPGRFMEVGRTCVHPAFRAGAALGRLWSGVARFMIERGFDYLMGCASIPMLDGGRQARSACAQLRRDYLSPAYLRVFPCVPLPHGEVDSAAVDLPPLLRAYLRPGAQVCGEPCWDPVFNVADVFVLVQREQLDSQYVRRFIEHALRERPVHADLLAS